MLEKLVRTPGDINKLRWIDPKDSTNAEQELDDEQKVELSALPRVLWKLFEKYGRVCFNNNKDSLDIQTYTREDFLDFVDNVFSLPSLGNSKPMKLFSVRQYWPIKNKKPFIAK